MVATANILFTLDRVVARRSLEAVLAEEPDLVGLQEWRPQRRRMLRERDDFHWVTPFVTWCVVGARADRFDPVEGRERILSLPGRADNPGRTAGFEPSRLAAVGVFRDRTDGSLVTLVSFHLVAGVQSRGRYHPDRPRLVKRHQGEARRLERLVADEQRRGRTTYAVGDSNLHGFALPGLASAWTGREHEPGTLGTSRRRVDDVFGPTPPDDVRRVVTDSDHQAVVVAWRDRGEHRQPPYAGA